MRWEALELGCLWVFRLVFAFNSWQCFKINLLIACGCDSGWVVGKQLGGL